MESGLAAMDPRPITPSAQYLVSASVPNIALNIGPERQIPDHPGSMIDIPRPSNNYGASPNAMMVPQQIRDVPSLKSHCQYGLREYMSLLRKRQRIDASSTSTLELESQLKSQQGYVLYDLRSLQQEVRQVVKEAENHRWRNWFIGGAIASFIPLIRKFFRRKTVQDCELCSNDTEFAFRRSKGLVAYIKEGMLGKGSFARIAFLVCAVLYVFSNEVTLRVARTVQKRLRKLTARIERGDVDIDERDLRLLEGWRWRVLLW